MAHFRRLIWFAFGVLLVGVPMLAFADDYSAQVVYGRNGQPPYHSSPLAVCQDPSLNAHYGSFKSKVTDLGSGSYDCTAATGERASQYGGPGDIVKRAYICPYGGTRSGYNCINAPSCEDGGTRNPSTGACETTPQQQCEQSGGHWGTNHSAGGRFVVQNNCYPNPPRCAEAGGMILLDESLDSRCAPPQEGSCPEDIGDIPYVGNLGGGQCLLGGGTEPDPEPEPDPKPEPDQTPPGCAPNQQSGTVQGVPVCINKPPPPPTDSTDTKTETKPTPDGGTKETTTTTNTTVNNTTNTTTTTTTVTTVIKDAAGNVTGTTTDTSSVVQDSAGYCKENPGAEVCGEGGAEWAGGCDDPGRVMHECKGDPIQCAIAEQTLRTRCALAASDEVVQAFKDIVDFDGTGEGEGLDRKEISVPETLDVMEIGGGEGLVDKSYTVMGRTITVPFSAINTYLDIFGAAMMMIAWIVAFNTIRGAI